MTFPAWLTKLPAKIAAKYWQRDLRMHLCALIFLAPASMVTSVAISWRNILRRSSPNRRGCRYDIEDSSAESNRKTIKFFSASYFKSIFAYPCRICCLLHCLCTRNLRKQIRGDRRNFAPSSSSQRDLERCC